MQTDVEQIVLEGITHKGLNCIRKKGPMWEIHARTETVLFNPEVGPWLFVSPKGLGYTSKDAMWIKAENDVNFKIR